MAGDGGAAEVTPPQINIQQQPQSEGPATFVINAGDVAASENALSTAENTPDTYVAQQQIASIAAGDTLADYQQKLYDAEDKAKSAAQSPTAEPIVAPAPKIETQSSIPFNLAPDGTTKLPFGKTKDEYLAEVKQHNEQNSGNISDWAASDLAKNAAQDYDTRFSELNPQAQKTETPAAPQPEAAAEINATNTFTRQQELEKKRDNNDLKPEEVLELSQLKAVEKKEQAEFDNLQDKMEKGELTDQTDAEKYVELQAKMKQRAEARGENPQEVNNLTNEALTPAIKEASLNLPPEIQKALQTLAEAINKEAKKPGEKGMNPILKLILALLGLLGIGAYQEAQKSSPQGSSKK